MILSYDSILGIPVVESGGINTQKNRNGNMGLDLGVPAILLMLIVVILFVVLFANLGKDEAVSDGSTSNGSMNILTVLLGGVVIAVLLLNGLQYFFNINLTAQLNNLFSDTPSLDLTVEQSEYEQEIAPVPEITIKKQVFHVPGNKYTYDDASALCKAYGSRLATYDEVENSYNNGAEWCSYGWSDKKLALFPTQKETWNYLQTVEGHENDCGRPGINGGFMANPALKFGVNCFGYKPKMTSDEEDLMNTQTPYPLTKKDVAMQHRVDYWKDNLTSVLVSPFNYTNWSKI